MTSVSAAGGQRIWPLLLIVALMSALLDGVARFAVAWLLTVEVSATAAGVVAAAMNMAAAFAALGASGHGHGRDGVAHCPGDVA